MIDLCRHWISPDTVLRTLDAMALAHLNVLHLHLSDDQAHRIQSGVWPRLHQMNADGRWWTHDDVSRVVVRADELGIRVVPELDMPGHTTAWIAAYPHLCATPDPPTHPRSALGIAEVGLNPDADSTFEFLDGLLDEITALFGDPYLHLGGDEVDHRAWPGRDVAATQAAFTDRVVEMAFARGRTPIVWDEAWHAALDRRVVVQVWRGHARLRAGAAEGRPVILSTPYYLDLAYDPRHHRIDPRSSADAWSARRAELWADPALDIWAPPAQGMEGSWELGVTDPPVDVDPTWVLGAEACLWTELCPDELVDLRIWPTVVAAADVWWSGDDSPIANHVLTARLHEFEQSLLAIGIDLDAQRRARWLDLADGEEALADDLAILAECCEPTKWYSRHAALPRGRLDQPFDRFVDTLGPQAIGPVAHRTQQAATRALERLRNLATTDRRLVEVEAIAATILADGPNLAPTETVGEVLVIRNAERELPVGS